MGQVRRRRISRGQGDRRLQRGVARVGHALAVIARSEATKQSSSAYGASGLLRFARNDGGSRRGARSLGRDAGFMC
ncbi:hypothetical protein D4Q52_13970 [Rhodopseudomonas palustris]|uniref:Uncharacterized protein n=1 Tax=Rhodopseudomonas palustris TaxID=1076 RepID=A0A418VCX2_RHOPL|nr:hypothetical protein D4Q52_13970 [Rhodopseudomonas palustris]